MNPDRAIEILKADLLIPGSVDKLDFQDAEQLGIEALKRCQENRTAHRDHLGQILPGETKD